MWAQEHWLLRTCIAPGTPSLRQPPSSPVLPSFPSQSPPSNYQPLPCTHICLAQSSFSKTELQRCACCLNQPWFQVTYKALNLGIIQKHEQAQSPGRACTRIGTGDSDHPVGSGVARAELKYRPRVVSLIKTPRAPQIRMQPCRYPSERCSSLSLLAGPGAAGVIVRMPK